MRQERITSYQDLEARIKYLDHSIAIFHNDLVKLHQFLAEIDGDKSSDNPEA